MCWQKNATGWICRKDQEVAVAISNLKEHFGTLLKAHIKKAKLRQRDVAAVLELSPSAVSQMLSGRLILNMKQLDLIVEKLSLDRNDCSELRDCLARIRAGDEELRSPLNDFIRSSRTKKGLSVEQLSQMSGISVENLQMLENRLNVQPTPHEAVRLAAIFECELNELWQVSPSTVIPMTTAGEAKRRASMFCDVSTPYKVDPNSAIKTPVVEFEELTRFDFRCDKLLDFAWRHMSTCQNIRKAGIVVVKASGAEFGWGEHYQVSLEIADTRNWIPGMTVLGNIEGELFLARATENPMQVKVIGDDEAFHCQWYWLVNSLSFESDLIDMTAPQRVERKLPRRTAMVARAQKKTDQVADQDKENNKK